MVRLLFKSKDLNVLNVDKLTYAANINIHSDISNDNRYSFLKEDISNQTKMVEIFEEFKPDKVFHLAAESHVDNSISDPRIFINSNIFGTFSLLEASRLYMQKNNIDSDDFRFIHVSTDEVFGSLDDEGLFSETTAYDPSSPYSASKASSDHLARAWYRTFDVPTICTNCSNNYGPFQHEEKLIPLVIKKAINSKKIPIYGDGKNIRDWLYVDDHVTALKLISEKGIIGSSYNIGGSCEKTNIELVTKICDILDELYPQNKLSSYRELISFVDDRKGHDKRYAMDVSKINNDLNWYPTENIDTGLRKTVSFYLQHFIK